MRSAPPSGLSGGLDDLVEVAKIVSCWCSWHFPSPLWALPRRCHVLNGGGRES